MCADFLAHISETRPTRIISPDVPAYVFYQFSPAYANHITRPLNSELFIDVEQAFAARLRKFRDILEILRTSLSERETAVRKRGFDPAIVDAVLYTMQQSLGSIADSFSEPNQARKRAGDLFERLVKLTIEAVGVKCEGRTVKIPIPQHPGRTMSYQLDMVLSRGIAVASSETNIIASDEIVGSVKTTSKDRIDKVFLDKFMMSKLLGRDVRVIAVFLHDVQRAKKKGSIFGINSTFKSGHFAGYTIALNPLDGVYYVDPRPVMTKDPDLAKQIGTFSRFLVKDLWVL